MLRVGAEMVREHPLAGVGPGQVNRLYQSYLRLDDPRPAWHGHLHNNLAQLAAEFGLVAVVGAALFVAVLAADLIKAAQRAADRDSQFLASTALLALVGFLVAGTFEYTYGHALGLILLSFAVLGPLSSRDPKAIDAAR
jgi:O-antigen ligase